MHAEIEKRFAALEVSREALVERVRALPAERRSVRPGGKSMSPTQLILHMALAEELSLKRMARRPPSELKQAQPKPTFLFRKVVATMQAAKESPGPPSTMPKKPINLEEAEAKWQEVRSQLRSRFAEAETPASVIQKGFPFGALSAADLFTLFESHAHYHTVRFPKI